MASASDRFVALKDGPIVPVEPYLLLFDLEARGLRVTRDGDDIVVSPAHLLTGDDCQRIRRWKLHLLALADYVANPPRVM